MGGHVAFNFSKFEAKLVLAWLFIIHLFKRFILFWKRGLGLTGFWEHFKADAVFPVNKVERVKFVQFQRCLNCSLCTLTCTAVIEGKGAPGFEPKMIPLSLLRSEHESELFSSDFFSSQWLPCKECNACVADCPNHLPLHEAVNFTLMRWKKVK